jgi:hypothetical protein
VLGDTILGKAGFVTVTSANMADKVICRTVITDVLFDIFDLH